MLKIATWDDYADILTMTMKFGEMMYAPYFDFEEHKIAEGIRSFLEADPSQKIILLAKNDEGRAVGMIAGAVEEAPFSTKRLAFEMVWWVDPEYRKSRMALELQTAFDFWTEKVKADICQMSLVYSDNMESIDKFYKRKGFVPLERSYIRNNHARH